MLDGHKALDLYHLGLVEAVVAASSKLDGAEISWMNQIKQFDDVTMEQLADCPARYKRTRQKDYS